MGFQFVVMFIHSFIDDVTYVRDVEVCMYSMITSCVRRFLIPSLLQSTRRDDKRKKNYVYSLLSPTNAQF